MKVFITVDLTKEDIKEWYISSREMPIDIKTKEMIPDNFIINLFDMVCELIEKEIPVQLKITNLPPRRIGFRPASELVNIEKGL